MALRALADLSTHPIQVIGITTGIVCTLAATAVGGYGIAYWIDESNFPGPLLGGGAILAVLGIEGFIMALIGEYLARSATSSVGPSTRSTKSSDENGASQCRM